MPPFLFGVFLLALAMTVGCAGGAERLSDCNTRACRDDWVRARWDRRRAEVVQELVRESPATQAALVQTLVLAYPDDTSDLCARLPRGGMAARRCSLLEQQRLMRRGAPRDEGAAPPEAEPEPTGPFHAEALALPWADLEPETVTCAGSPELCQREAALQAAAEGQASVVAARCLALSEQSARARCFVDGSARLLEPLQDAQLRDGVSLCAGAGALVGRCLLSSLGSLARAAPCHNDRAAAWAEAAARVTAVSEAAAAIGADPDGALAERAWSEILRAAYEPALELHSAPAAWLPDVAKPQLRAVLASRLWSLEHTQSRSALDWGARLSAALARPRAPAARGGERARFSELHPTLLWVRRLAGEEDLPAVSFLVDGQRLLVADAETDALVCLLEAAASSRFPSTALLEDALEHPRWEVRWTAARLLAHLAPTSAALREARRDPNPLVRARAAQGEGRGGSPSRAP